MLSYQEYILSPAWIALARTIKKRDGCCLKCAKKTDLHCHHGTYKNLGQERKKELFTLCAYCHFELHKRYKKKKKQGLSLLVYTKNYIRRRPRAPSRKKTRVVKQKPVSTPNTFNELLHGLVSENPRPEEEKLAKVPFVRPLTVRQRKHLENVAGRRKRRKKRNP